MNYEELLNKILKSLSNLIFMIEEDITKIKKKNYIIKIEDTKGNLIKKIEFKEDKEDED